jgi:hypothetical protein
MDLLLKNAPDDAYWLPRKVALIIAVHGLMREKELEELDFEHFEVKDEMIIIDLYRKKQRGPKTLQPFVITNQQCIAMIKKYIKCCPPEERQKRFLRYMNNKLQVQRRNIGIHTIQQIPRNIAAFLQLPNPELFSFHSFKRSAATAMAANGATIQDLKRGANWRSSTVAERYIDNSMANKKRTADLIALCAEDSKNEHESEGKIKQAEMAETVQQREESEKTVRSKAQAATNLNINISMKKMKNVSLGPITVYASKKEAVEQAASTREINEQCQSLTKKLRIESESSSESDK